MLKRPPPNVLIVAARFYDDIADGLEAGAMAVLEEAGATIQQIEVPGALEIPGAIAMVDAKSHGAGMRYHGFVALGCVIRGETSHYDTVAGESARGLMELSLRGLAIGNGVLTVENREQAMVRADPAQKDKGGDAARACLRMVELSRGVVS